MAIDTLAYVKTLEAAGVDRRAAEAHAAAPSGHVVPDLATRADLDQAVERLEHRIEATIERAMHQQRVRFFGMLLGVVGVMDAVLFALLRVGH
jgi:hypothetical protein